MLYYFILLSVFSFQQRFQVFFCLFMVLKQNAVNPTGSGSCDVVFPVIKKNFDGAYLVSDYCTGWVQALLVGEDDAIEAVDLGLHIPSPSSFGTDQDGNVYVLSLEGTVFRLDPA